MKKILRILSYYLGKKDYIYNDPTSIGMIPSDRIPDVIMDRDVIIYNCGFDIKRECYRVIAGPIKSNNIFDLKN